MQPNHRQQESAIVSGSQAIFTRSEFIGIAVPLLASGSATGTPKPPPVLTVRWLECVVGNVDYLFKKLRTFTCMFWEGEKRRALGPTDNIHTMPP
jgi:hypothetical protein